ncbi:MAG: twin-arginine translocase subunit TatC [Bacteroidetes bacterium]|nr:MAG: twin-arginine translocase subunit TatC [Bacteroidota bacterium]
MSKKNDGEMTFLEHLEVMRFHLIRSLIAVVIMALVAFVFKEIVFDKIILAPKEPDFVTNKWLCQLGEFLGLQRICINQDPFGLQTVKMAEQFSMHIIVSLVAGVVVAFPYMFWEFWRFIVPALYENEKRTASGAVFYTSLLFLLGVGFGYYIISPLSVNFLGNYRVSESVISAPTLRSYVQTVTSVVLASGIVFQLPILVYFLSRVGLVTPDFLKKYRRHSIILIVTLSAIITPPDVFSQVLVALPLMVLYEIGIAISRRILRQREAEDRERKEEEKRRKAEAERRKKKTAEEEANVEESPGKAAGGTLIDEAPAGEGHRASEKDEGPAEEDPENRS